MTYERKNSKVSRNRVPVIEAAGRVPGRPKPGRVSSGDRLAYASDEGLS